MLVVLFALLTVCLAAGQNFNPTTDVLGAHNNGGRGCAACHAPHSGGRGSGGSTVAGSGITSSAGAEGDYHLWGQDVSLITQETLQVGGGFGTGGAGFAVNFGGAQQWTSTSLPVISGIAVCLSCHDGNVSKGAMMMNQSYEQAWGLLPNGGSQHATSGPLYGTTPIPTLLGNDGGAVGDYLNDHPVGPNASVNGLNHPKSLSAYGLNYTVNGTAITWTTSGQYANFVTNYGAPAINAMVVDATNQVPYVVCTTCHNQHQMNVYSSGKGLTTIAGNSAGNYATYFFVNAPYNPGAAWTPMAAPSTTQFCRQCHFGEANEAYGLNAVTTAF
jgi:hypothetical protein